MKKKWIVLILTALLFAACAAAQKPAGGDSAKMTLTLTTQYWTGWSEEQPEATVQSFENVAEGTVIYDGGSFYGTVEVAEVTADGIRLSLHDSCFVEPNDGGGINLTAPSVESLTIQLGEEKELVSKSLDGGVYLWIALTRGPAPTPAPTPSREAKTPAPTPEREAEDEPLPYASATFANKNEAEARMMRLYDENRALLMAVAEDLKASAHGEIENGVVYSIRENGFADMTRPYASMTDAIRAFLALPDSGDYTLSWIKESVFLIELRWTNDSGYYSTQLVYAEDGQKIVKMMSEKGGSTLEPLYEDCGWGVYTTCWKKAPYWCDTTYAVGKKVGVWKTDDLPFLYLEVFENGTARILSRFDGTDIRAHYAWHMPDRNSIKLTFSDQSLVESAQLNTDTDIMTLSIADGGRVEATRATDVVLPLRAEELLWARNPVTLPAVCPAGALGTSAKKTIEGILFLYDLDGDGAEETISFSQSPDDGETPVIISIDDTEYPLHELNVRDKVRQAILFQPDPASDGLALAVTTDDIYADWNETAILLLHGKEVREIKAEFDDAYAYLSDGTLRITARCWLIGTYYGSRAYAGANLEPASEWYETGVLDRVKDWTREERIEFNQLFEVVRDLPCTIDGQPAVIAPGTWVYLLRWKETEDFAEIMTEDGRVALLAFTLEHGQRFEGGNDDTSWYCIDGVDAESYFDNLNMAG